MRVLHAATVCWLTPGTLSTALGTRTPCQWMVSPPEAHAVPMQAQFELTLQRQHPLRVALWFGMEQATETVVLSPGLLLESKSFLFGTDEGDDGLDLVVGKSLDRFHGSEIPMVLRRTIRDRRSERVICVVIRFVNGRPM